MQLTIAGHGVFAATGGRSHADGQPLAVFIHGAGGDRTAWAHQSRWLAFHGWNVLAVDLPGHGRSEGAPLATIGASAQWLCTLLDRAGAVRAALIGHSMGALIALEAAARAPARVSHAVLLGAAAAMPVRPDLLAAAASNDPVAIDMVNLWGLGPHAGLGGSHAPGVWMVGAGQRTLQRARPGVLHADLAACNAYGDGPASAARVGAPTCVVCGEKDQMTPLGNGRALAAAIAGAQLTVLPGAGHMLMVERPREVVDAIATHLAVNRRRGAPAAPAVR